MRSPLEWGTEARLADLFGAQASGIQVTRKHCTFSSRSAEHWVEFFRAYYGPTNRTFAALDAAGQQAFQAALVEYLLYWNQNEGEALRSSAEYLEVIVTT